MAAAQHALTILDYALTTKSGEGAETSYSALQLAEEEQRKLPPILLKPMLLALTLAGLPPLTESDADLASYSHVAEQVNTPAALLTVIVPLPPLPVTSADHGVPSEEAVHFEPPLVSQLFQVIEVISPETATPEPPSLWVFPDMLDSEHSTVMNPDDITAFVPGTRLALIDVPFL